LIVGFLTLPLIVTFNNLYHKKVLHDTLEYLYSPDHSKEYTINTTSLEKTLNTIKTVKGRRRHQDFILQDKLPLLTSFFTWIVLDRLTLPNDKINLIEQVFFGKEAMKSNNINRASKHIKITNIGTESTFDATQNAWTSWIDIELTNERLMNLQEYATTINLPEGAWINNYYLYVGPVKEMGMLSEKKSATWIYSMIRNTRRDPGILYYLSGNKVAFKVYPFGGKEIRKTGIEIIHKKPIQISIDGHELDLCGEEFHEAKLFENDHAYFITASDKKRLHKMKRKPYYHFILEAHDQETIENQSVKIANFRRKMGVLGDKAKVSFSNNLSRHYSMDKSWETYFEPSKHQGGFYADFGIKSILQDSYNSGLEDYPVIVLVTDNFDQAIIQKDFSDWKFCFPDSDLFYVLDEHNHLLPYSLTNTQKQVSQKVKESPDPQVRIFNLKDGTTRYLPDNQESSIVLKSAKVELDIKDIEEGSWDSGLSMQAKVRSQLINPDPSQKEWHDQVKASFKSKIMSPVTSYIVLETEAQRALLLKKQKEMLSGHKSLDAEEEQRNMSEPELWILLLMLGLFMTYKRRNEVANFYSSRY